MRISLLFVILFSAIMLAEGSVTTEQKLRAENLLLKKALIAAQLQAAQCDWNNKVAALESELRTALGAKPDDVIDLETLTIRKK